MVEHLLAKEGVASSNLVFRSIFMPFSLPACDRHGTSPAPTRDLFRPPDPLPAQDECKIFSSLFMVSLSNHQRIERASLDRPRMTTLQTRAV